MKVVKLNELTPKQFMSPTLNQIKSHPCEEVEELSPFASCLIASALGGRTESLFAIAFSMKGEGGGDRHIL